MTRASQAGQEEKEHVRHVVLTILSSTPGQRGQHLLAPRREMADGDCTHPLIPTLTDMMRSESLLRRGSDGGESARVSARSRVRCAG